MARNNRNERDEDTGELSVRTADAGAVGADLVLFQDSASPATSDDVGIIKFQGNDSAGNATVYAQFEGTIASPTHPNEIGGMSLQVQNAAGSLVQCAGVFHTGSFGGLSVGDSAAEAIIAGSGNQLLQLITNNGIGGSITISPTTTGGVRLANGGAGGSIELDGPIVYSEIKTSSGAGAVSILGGVHEVTTTGTGDALTLDNGNAGQRLCIVYVAEGNGADTAIITPTTLAGGSTITLNALGDSCDLVYSSTGGWYVLGLGGTAAVA